LKISANAGSSSHHPWLALLIVLMAPFMATVDFYIIFVASPSIQYGLHASPEQIQFVIAGYTIAYGVNLITAGRLGDTYGRKRMFMIGMTSFIITSALCAFAQDPLTLIITRVFQGTAAALMFPQALSIIQATFISKQKNIAVALYGTALGIGATAGQLLGGFLVQANLFNLDWRLIFLVNLPIGIGTLFAALLFVHESKSEKPIRLDIVGAAIMSLILFLLLYPLIEGRGAGWPLWMYATIILSIILIVPFIFFERRLSTSEHDYNTKNSKTFHSASKAPLVPLLLFKDRSFVIGTSIIIVFYIGYTAFIFVLTFYLQNGLGLSSLTSGLTFLPLGVGFLVSSSLTPKIVPKLDGGILKIGAIVIIIGYGLLIITTHQQSNIGLQWSQLLQYMFIIGIGNGFLIVPLIDIILSRVKDQQYAGAASGMYNTMTAIGNAMGIAFIGSIFFGLIGTGASPATGDIGGHTNGSYNHVRIHHFTDAFIISILYTLVLVIVTLFMVFLLPSHTSKEQKPQKL
jgi:EmrB/QacA subfamily drug resistance transporter